MESAAVLRSFNYSLGYISNPRSSLDKPGILPVHNTRWSTSSVFPFQGLTVSRKPLSSPLKRDGMVVSCVNTSDSTVIAKSDVISSDTQGSSEKSSPQRAIFPSEFEALVREVCDETQIAELKLKIGGFEMHLKRNIESPVAVAYPAPAPPAPSKPVVESSPAPAPPKSSSGKTNPFANVPVEKSRKLAALEASGASGYVLVASPTVGSFRKGRTLKGKKQPPSCKEGDLIKEGQVIGFLDQFSTELPVKSDVAGEVIKLLFDDGEAVGYGDPLIAVLPSFHGIQ